MNTHDLKCWPEFFTEVDSGRKTFEVRLKDRDYKVGDLLELREWVPSTGTYTGRFVFRRVTYITTHATFVPEGYCIMGLAKPAKLINHRLLRARVAGILRRSGLTVEEGSGLPGEIIELVTSTLTGS